VSSSPEEFNSKPLGFSKNFKNIAKGGQQVSHMAGRPDMRRISMKLTRSADNVIMQLNMTS
jgi:hypothetical protein